ncbi:MAG: dephospho-CoA kinase [Pseudomonadota bacterium]
MKRIAITGGIASGKSSAAERFAKAKFPVASADQFARDVVAPASDGLRDVVDAFGAEVLSDDGSLNRGALRRRIFADDAERKRLEAILHPRIREATRQWCETQGDQGAFAVVIEVPLLVETGQQHSYDHVVVVDLPTEQQLDRVCARDSIDRASAQDIIDKQATRSDRLLAATDILLNDGPLPALQSDADALARRITSLYG